MYVDGGPAVAYDVVERLIGPGLAATAARLDHLDHKSRLQELVAMAGGPPPEYTTRAEGPDHAKRFFAAVSVGWAGARRGDRPLQEGRRAGRRRGRLRSLADPWRLMPELPEVETVRRGLADRVVGRRIDRVEVGRPRTVRRTSATEVIDGLTGASMIAADRRGKYLLCPLDTGDTVMFHLRMSGQLLLAADGAPRPAHTHVALSLAGPDREQLLFVDPRTFGEVVVFDPDHVEVELPELARLGVDPLADGLGVDALGALVGGRRTALKPLLLDQHVIAGIGNIYADEILHAARLHPTRSAGVAAPRRGPPPARAVHRILRRRRGRRVVARRQPVRRPDGGGWLVPGLPRRLRTRRHALPDVRPGHHPPHGQRRPQHALLRVVPARASGRLLRRSACQPPGRRRPRHPPVRANPRSAGSRQRRRWQLVASLAPCS